MRFLKKSFFNFGQCSLRYGHKREKRSFKDGSIPGSGMNFRVGMGMGMGTAEDSGYGYTHFWV